MTLFSAARWAVDVGDVRLNVYVTPGTGSVYEEYVTVSSSACPTLMISFPENAITPVVPVTMDAVTEVDADGTEPLVMSAKISTCCWT